MSAGPAASSSAPSTTRGWPCSRVGEVLKELYQAEHQRGRDVSPRMHRDLHYAIERAVTNVGLRTISTALVIEEMYRGAPVIFVDYTAYDAVAHHSGPERRESIDALEGIDRAIGSLLKADVHATRRYHVVLLSDHGQSMGPIFRQVYGQPVEALLGKLMPGEAVVVGSSGTAESAGNGGRIAAELGRGTGFAPFLARQGPAILRRVRVTRRHGGEATVNTRCRGVLVRQPRPRLLRQGGRASAAVGHRAGVPGSHRGAGPPSRDRGGPGRDR